MFLMRGGRINRGQGGGGVGGGRFLFSFDSSSSLSLSSSGMSSKHIDVKVLACLIANAQDMNH